MKIKNPVITELRKSADPFVTFYNGAYYSCYTDTHGVYVSKAASLDTLAAAEEHCVFDRCGEWYAPELHKIENKWYIYGAPADLEGYTTHTMSVLVSESDDPLSPYTFKGQIKGLENKWAIDGTLLYANNKTYMIWSNGELLISEMSDPFTLIGEQYVIAKPELPFETVMNPVAEGPFVLKKDNLIHIVYAASDSRSDDYCLGLLTCKNGNVTDKDSWIKSETPVFKKANGIFGPGHCSVTQYKTSDGMRDIMIYHANSVSGSGWNGREVYLQPISYENGYPVFGEPQQEITL